MVLKKGEQGFPCRIERSFSFARAKAIASSQVSRWGSLHSQLKKHVVTPVHGPQMMQTVDRAKGARKGWQKVPSSLGTMFDEGFAKAVRNGHTRSETGSLLNRRMTLCSCRQMKCLSAHAA